MNHIRDTLKPHMVIDSDDQRIVIFQTDFELSEKMNTCVEQYFDDCYNGQLIFTKTSNYSININHNSEYMKLANTVSIKQLKPVFFSDVVLIWHRNQMRIHELKKDYTVKQRTEREAKLNQLATTDNDTSGPSSGKVTRRRKG